MILLPPQGIGQLFHFQQSPHDLNQYTIYTSGDEGRGKKRKLYLKPRSSTDTIAPDERERRDIVASVEQGVPFNFRLTSANPNKLTLKWAMLLVTKQSQELN